jgi:hypothetical protein
MILNARNLYDSRTIQRRDIHRQQHRPNHLYGFQHPTTRRSVSRRTTALTMDDQDRINCKCDNQFLNTDCLGYTIKSVEEVKKNQGDDPRAGSYFCQCKPPISKSLPDIQPLLTVVVRNYPSYIPISSNPRTTHLPISLQRPNLQQPNPWQPSSPHFSIQPHFLLQRQDRDPRTRWMGISCLRRGTQHPHALSRRSCIRTEQEPRSETERRESSGLAAL